MPNKALVPAPPKKKAPPKAPLKKTLPAKLGKMVRGKPKQRPVKMIPCKDCPHKFPFGAKEQAQFTAAKWPDPIRCSACRIRIGGAKRDVFMGASGKAKATEAKQ